MLFRGYKRENGTFGVRNHVMILSTESCANGVVNAIARLVPGVVPVTHSYGCGTGPASSQMNLRILSGLATNPNVSGVVVIGLGCEAIQPSVLAGVIAESGKPVETLLVQDAGSVKTTQKGAELASALLRRAQAEQRTEAPIESLIIGLECDGSDALSGVTANPSVGVAADILIKNGATVLLSETTEMIGTTHILQRRAATPEVRARIGDMIGRVESQLRAMGIDPQQTVTPADMAGGITCLTEKSLGCIAKGGTSPINEVVDYGFAPTRHGLVLMDTPGSAAESMAGMAAGGAQIIVFTTGRGTSASFPAIPVIKVGSNSDTYARMGDDIDMNAGRIIDENLTIEAMGREVYSAITEIASGRPTKAEMNELTCFGFVKHGATN